MADTDPKVIILRQITQLLDEYGDADTVANVSDLLALKLELLSARRQAPRVYEVH